MNNKGAMLATAAVILFLPEANRLDLLTAAAVTFFVTAYFEKKLLGLWHRIQDADSRVALPEMLR